MKFEHDSCGIGAVCQIDGTASNDIVQKALTIVEKLEHRAGKDASGTIGDGVGILLQISPRFFQTVFDQMELGPFEKGKIAVGMFFFPQNSLERGQAKKLFETIVKKEGAEFLGWRRVPVDEQILAQGALDSMPWIEQGFIRRPDWIETDREFDRFLYLIRREFEKSCPDTYVVSLSCRTVVYKGLLLVDQLRRFYQDLQDPRYESAIALVHSRFSTNTTPSWIRAHPNRLIAHNGEINTIRGNANRMLAREESMESDWIEENYARILPVINVDGSDSAILDNTLEFLTVNGMDLAKAMMITIPEPWKHKQMPQEKRDFYHYYATMMEPWDGPAAILFSDGELFGATLDRNGLRPSRYYKTKDNQFILSSEVGVLDLDESEIESKGRLEPGKMLLIDTVKGKLIEDSDLKEDYAFSQPYGEWLDLNLLHLADLDAPDKKPVMHSQKERNQLMKVFGYSYEDVYDQILPMARDGKEPLASMGRDVPLAVLSRLHPSLFEYFHQQFAQVTNPPIDSNREKIVTDTTVYIGSQGNLLAEDPENCRVLEVNHPILDSRDMEKIRHLSQDGFRPQTISLLYYRGMPLKDALEQLFLEADRAYKNGKNILILSDQGVDENHMAIPSLLAVSALQQHLVRTKRRTAVSIILESAEPKTVHEFAALLGYGATAIYPYLAHEIIEDLVEQDVLDKESSRAIADYNEAVMNGIVKIAAKMGISTLQSYQGAQIFEAVGIDQDVIDRYFTHTVCQTGGIGLKEMEEDLIYHHRKAFDPLDLKSDISLDSIGKHKLRSGQQSEDHLYSPEVITTLQKALWMDDYQLFKEYTDLLETKPDHSLRNLFRFESNRQPVALEEVESVDEIVKRFKTGAMSYGSISREAHECMAQAMNTLGGKSNSGEGGEDPARFGTDKNSAIKQVASGRFGVTNEYLVSAKEIQIKMAQGAKPGEGGHLPGNKVYPWIAKTRYSTPGVSLISPPPHHDIYSIEDLAQLIYDLQNANTEARISVKLVSENGVGTIACGVAKAGAKVILISGFDGGTGAANQSSIHHAGLPWELGLIQAHTELCQNGLREQVLLETDGKLMSGKDVAFAALLGAEEFGFATAPLVAMGCRMMRVCNLDTCPFGVATQNKALRERFMGKPEYVIRLMRFIAQDLRELMAELGFRTLDEMIGHAPEILRLKEDLSKRENKLRLEELISQIPSVHHDPEKAFDFRLERTKDSSTLIPALKKKIRNGENGSLSLSISSTDRSFGTQLGSYLTKHYPGQAEEDQFVIQVRGGAGQSFGAFIPEGVTLKCEGDANDYFGKGLSGGKLVIYPSSRATFNPSKNVIIGNVALYGATSGKAYICGTSGERFCVRNSGATAVCEGCGDHGLEYMTGGTAVILGETGDNFAAGMSGGTAYVLDLKHSLYKKINKELISIEPVQSKRDVETLQHILEDYYKETNSKKARWILENYEAVLPHFKKIIPTGYQNISRAMKYYQDKGFTLPEAQLKAFEDLYA